MQSFDAKDIAGGRPLTTHMDTRHLRWATTFAMLVAFHNSRDELLTSDLIAGIYIANFERVARFWPHPEIFDDFVAEHCQWSEPRWMTWQRWVDELRNAPWQFHIPFTSSYLTFLSKKRRRSMGRMFRFSPELTRLFEVGEQLTPHRIDWQGKTLPLLSPETMLLAVIRTEDIPLAKNLRDTGLLVERLEEAVARPIEKPERLMF